MSIHEPSEEFKQVVAAARLTKNGIRFLGNSKSYCKSNAQLPKKKPPPIKRPLKNPSKVPCLYCRTRKYRLTRDHCFTPKSKGGKIEAGNVVMCCAFCNEAKSSLTPEQWLKHLQAVKGLEPRFERVRQQLERLAWYQQILGG